MPVTTRALTPDRWADFEELFGPQGACYGCWCTYFRLPPKTRKLNDKEANKAHMKARIMAGPPPGILAYGDDGRAIGWLQIGPRADVPEWNNARRVSAPVDDALVSDPEVWAVSCFFAKSAERGRGLAHDLLAGGLAFARESGARIVEACPIDHAKTAKSVGLFVGSTPVFQKAGFRQVALRKSGRPLMRLDLQS